MPDKRKVSSSNLLEFILKRKYRLMVKFFAFQAEYMSSNLIVCIITH